MRTLTRLSSADVARTVETTLLGPDLDGDSDRYRLSAPERGFIVQCDAVSLADLHPALVSLVDLMVWSVTVEPYPAQGFTHRIVLFEERRREVRS